jgi:thiamine pyrophosphate-dependent acetolactate synthase large subunit-like protein
MSPTPQESSCRAPPKVPLATTGSATPAARSVRDFPSPRVPPLLHKTAQYCIEADGSAMYTLQALWTQAREGLDVTTVILSNRAYAILNLELSRVGAGAGGPRAERMLELSSPGLDFVSLAHGMGVPASRARTAEDLAGQLEAHSGNPART